MSDAYKDDEVYPNSPLSDVACEARFPGDMRVECDRHLFWDQVRDQYPKIMVPQAFEGKAPALQHYRFKSDDARTVSVALNSLAYSEAKYRGHKLFIAEFLRLAELFASTYPTILGPTRVGWRYINLMPFTKENEVVPVNRFLRFGMNLPLGMFTQSVGMDLQWSGRHEDAAVVIRLAVVPRKELQGQEALLLDIDYAKESTAPGFSWSDLSSVVDSARRVSRQIFEEMIADEYRDYLRGQTL